MYKHLSVTGAAVFLMLGAGHAQAQQRRASFLGGGSPDRGKCTVEVVVDGAAEVDIRGDSAMLRNLSGQPPQWRRFECTGPLPPSPADFRFAGVDGRGRQQLIRDPRNGGVAVVRIEDSGGGSEGYTFDIFWGGNAGGGGYPIDSRPGGDRPGARRWTTEQAVRQCQEAVGQQAAQRFNRPDLSFRSVRLDDNPGRRDWVVGVFDIRSRNDRPRTYQFSCSVDFDSGRLRSAEIGAEEGGRFDGDYRGPDGRPRERYAEACREAVRTRLRRDGYGQVDFGPIDMDRGGGRDARLNGSLRAMRGNRSESFDFSCSVDWDSGSVRDVRVVPPERR